MGEIEASGKSLLTMLGPAPTLPGVNTALAQPPRLSISRMLAALHLSASLAIVARQVLRYKVD